MTDESKTGSRINLNDLIKERRTKNPVRVLIYIDKKLGGLAGELFESQDNTFADFNRRIYRLGLEAEEKRQELKRKQNQP